jgi:hypothetical protein
VLICGTQGRYFVPIGQIKSLLTRIPSNRNDGRWDLYIRFEDNRAYFGVTRLVNHLDVTEQLQHFEQIWEKPEIEEVFVSEAIYIPDSSSPFTFDFENKHDRFSTETTTQKENLSCADNYTAS